MKVTDIDALRRMKELNSAGRYDESVNVAIALLNVNKENVEALDSLGLYYLAKKKFAKAAACFHKALSLDEFGDGYQTPTKVPMRPLKVILEDKVPDGVPIDFFSIDVEDSELGVVRSNDWSRFRPRLIVMETHTFRMEHPRNCLATALLLDEGYEVIGNFAGNVFLKDSSVTDNR